jgi:hypothetical protein
MKHYQNNKPINSNGDAGHCICYKCKKVMKKQFEPSHSELVKKDTEGNRTHFRQIIVGLGRITREPAGSLRRVSGFRGSQVFNNFGDIGGRFPHVFDCIEFGY